MDPACGEIERLVVVDGGVAQLGVRVAWTVAWGPSVGQLDGSRLDHLVAEAIAEASSRYTLESLRGDPVVRAYRDFYWRIGVDPTKVRPSGEALVRRALRGRFPRINPVVDSGNVASARTLVPIGIYDLDRAVPPLMLVLSRGGEEFRPIGGGLERLRAGLPILVDSRGVVLHLYPHRDSVETMVRPSTRRALILAAGVDGVGDERLYRALELVASGLELVGWSTCRRASSAP